MRPSNRFIGGLPTKVATNVLPGGCRPPSVVPTCCMTPSRQDDDAVGHRHRLDLVVGDVDRRAADAPVQLQQLGAHLHPQQRVEVRERLVHEEGDRLADDGPPQRHPLPLPAGELVRVPLQVLGQAEQLRDLGDPAATSAFGRPRIFSGKPMLRLDGHVRVEGVVLEDHRHVAVFGPQVVGQPAVDVDLAVGGILQPGDDLQERALAAARRPEQDEELARLDIEVDALQGGVTAAVALRHAHQLDRSGGWRRPASSAVRSLLQRSGQRAGEELALQEQEEDRDRDQRHHRAADQTP